MGLRIMTNVQSLAAQRYLNMNVENQKNSLEHLASGTRINKAGDDAASLAISEKLKSEIRSLRQATRNTSDGISMIQVAEGSMNEIGNILTRLRELSIQSASDTIGDEERGFTNKEVQQLKQEIQRIAQVTEFNHTRLLDGSAQDLDIQVGLNNNPMLDRLTYSPALLNSTLGVLGLEGVSTSTKEMSQENLKLLDDAIVHINGNRATLGALQNRLQSTIANLNIYRENLENANSRIRDTDVAQESSEMTKNSILSQASVSVLAQANNNPQLALKLLG